MSQDKDHDINTQKVEAAYRNASREAPSPELDATILRMAEQRAEQIRSGKHKLIPFSAQNRLTGLSLAASMVLAVSLVVVMQREAPDQLSFEQPIILSDMAEPELNEANEALVIGSNSKQLLQKEITEPSRIDQVSEGTTASDQVDFFSPDENTRSQRSAPEVKRESPTTAGKPAEMDRVAIPENAEFEAPASLSIEAGAGVTPERRRAKAEKKHQAPVTRIYTPALNLKNISLSSQLTDTERLFLVKIYNQSQTSKDDYFSLWSRTAKNQIEKMMTRQKNWQHYQTYIKQAKILARINHETHIIFVLEQHEGFSGLNGTLPLSKEGSTFALDFLPLNDATLSEKIESLRQQVSR